jgi:sulfotransferase family protein
MGSWRLWRTTPEFHWDAPIIVIGAGRSGTTMITAVLGEHPEVYAAGETSFLLNRLWDEYFRLPDYVNSRRLGKLTRNSRREWREMSWYEFSAMRVPTAHSEDVAATEIGRREERRISLCLGRFMAETLVPPELRCRYWSFTEVWNGSTSFAHGWHRHDLAFPKARYVHVVRHPLPWLRSYLLNMKLAPGREQVLFALRNWADIVNTARRQEQHGERYMVVRLEDFKTEPAAAVRTLLRFLGLADDARCHDAAGFTYSPSSGDLDLPKLTPADLDEVPELFPVMRHFGYELQDQSL